MDKIRFTHVKGVLTEILLTEINAQPKGIHGYALIVKIRRRLQIYLGPSTVYPALVGLEKKGYVKSEWHMTGERPRKLYKLTAEGQRTLDSLTRDLQFILRVEAIV